MALNFNANWIIAVLLCSLRLSALLLATPMLQALALPIRIRILLILILSISLVSGMRLAPVNANLDLATLIAAGAYEVMVGALMAYGIFTAFAAFSFAGNALDLQIGFNIANIFDPITRSQSPLIASLFGMLAVALFFTMDAHHTLIRGVAYSLERIPLGSAMQMPAPAELIRQFGSIFSLGLMLVAPPLFCLFLVDLALAVLSRNLQQINILMLSVPIKIAVGLSVLAYMAGQIGSIAEKIFSTVFLFWESVL